MKIYDQHMHTDLSYDCAEQYENYIKIASEKELPYIVTTEHLDLSCCLTGEDMYINLERQERIILELQAKYNVQILRGVELGYKFSRIEDMEKIVNTNNYDLVVMGVHEDEFADCTTEGFLKGKSAEKAYSDYLDIYINMLQNCSCYDIVAHIDYLLRYLEKINIENHKEKLTKLLELIISKNKALEFNTRFLYQHNDESYLIYIFTLYHKLGGRKISLGSDAHNSQFYMGAFDRAREILKKLGFEYLTLFQKDKEINVLI